jgi:hypothetical protein
MLEPGNYSADGLPVVDVHGTAAEPITITGPAAGPRAVILGVSGKHTVRINDSAFVVIRNLEVDSGNLGGDGINSRGIAHHVTLENLYVHGCSDDQQTVGISANHAPTWNWVIRGNTIADCGTGMYLGNSDGNQQFLAGVIEYNVVHDTIGYNIEIKHQNPLPIDVPGLPLTTTKTIIRHNVFSKANRPAREGSARPNLLIGHSPLSGAARDNRYEIYGNFFWQNPSGESLFQGEGNIALYDNLFVNSVDPDSAPAAVRIAPHNGRPRDVKVFNNTVVTRRVGIIVSGGEATFRQTVTGNAVFAHTPLNAQDARDNITDTYERAAAYLTNPFGTLGALDLSPKLHQLTGGPIDTANMDRYTDWDSDFNGARRTSFFVRGAYGKSGPTRGWLPTLTRKPTTQASER